MPDWFYLGLGVFCFLAAAFGWWWNRRSDRHDPEPNVVLHIVHRAPTNRGVTISCQSVRRQGRADHEGLFLTPVTRSRRVA
jgi:hypothetical protein